ncbi:hypothetical protein ACQPYK_24070 [Streptosporangium sp. CA-135522]|uniref:hypothetical protein n=1 Tax=Streptosporangium sp. CA-135522 TaxID=3240072 RepID=UPI003D8A3D76
MVIGTRPKINDYLAAYDTDRYLRIGQEHLTRALHGERNRTHQDAAIPGLDAFVTVSHADARHYRAALPYALAAGTVITAIPNPVAVPEVAPSDGGSRRQAALPAPAAGTSFSSRDTSGARSRRGYDPRLGGRYGLQADVPLICLFLNLEAWRSARGTATNRSFKIGKQGWPEWARVRRST